MSGEVGGPPGGKMAGANPLPTARRSPADIDRLRRQDGSDPAAGKRAQAAFNRVVDQRSTDTLSEAGWNQVSRTPLSGESGQALMTSLGEVFGVHRSWIERLGGLIGLDAEVNLEELHGKSVEVAVDGNGITLTARVLAPGKTVEIDYEQYDFRTLRIGLDQAGAATEIRTRGYDGSHMLALAQMAGIDLPAEIERDLSRVDAKAVVSELAVEHRERREAEAYLAAEMDRAAAPDAPGLPSWPGSANAEAHTFVLQGAHVAGDLSHAIASSGFDPCFCLVMVDRDSGRQMMAHIDALVQGEDATRLIDGFGAGESTEVMIVPGPETRPADMVNVYLALQDKGLAEQTAFADSLAVHQERGTALVLQDGDLYRTHAPVINWPFGGQFID